MLEPPIYNGSCLYRQLGNQLGALANNKLTSRYLTDNNAFAKHLPPSHGNTDAS